MGSYLARFGNRIIKFGNENYNDTDKDVEMYDDACKESMKGIALVMEGLDEGNAQSIEMGAARAWDGIKTMKKLSNKMKYQFGERRNDNYDNRGGNYNNRGGYNNRHDEGDWNQRDEEWMERRMRDARGRFM